MPKTMLRNTRFHEPKKYDGMKPYVTTTQFRGAAYGHTVYAKNEKTVKKSLPGHRVDGILIGEKDL